MTSANTNYTAPSRLGSAKHERGEKKISHVKRLNIAIKVENTQEKLPRKPTWIRAKAQNSPEVVRIKKLLRENNLHSVCEEAQCPNLGECFAHGTATFLVMGDICTRRCPFCDVAHGQPDPLDVNEPHKLGESIAKLGLKYVVITSVDRDDLRDGGAQHFAECVRQTRLFNPYIQVEILVPDFLRRMDVALACFSDTPPDVFNHNMETVKRLYRSARPRASYEGSLKLLQSFKQQHPHVPTKSGIMVGLGETKEEIIDLLADLRAHDCNMLTIGQYLQPSLKHLSVDRFVHPDEFKYYEELGLSMGFTHVASGPMVRSSYHADMQAKGVLV